VDWNRPTSGLLVTRQVNSELECEIYIGVGFDALARDRKPSVLLAHKQRTVVTKKENIQSKTLAGDDVHDLLFRTDKCASPSESRTT